MSSKLGGLDNTPPGTLLGVATRASKLVDLSNASLSTRSLKVSTDTMHCESDHIEWTPSFLWRGEAWTAQLQGPVPTLVDGTP